MKTKHTSGPWYYSNYAVTFMLQDGPYYEDNLILSYDEAFSAIDMETAEANAKLAAAAPELLEALQNIENDDNGIPTRIWEMRNAAIKKATE